MRVIKIPGPEEKLSFILGAGSVLEHQTGEPEGDAPSPAGRHSLPPPVGTPFPQPCSQGTWCPALVGISTFEPALD